MKDWIQIIIVIVGMILTAQQSHKHNKRKKRIAAARKAAVGPSVVLDNTDIESQPGTVLQPEIYPTLQDASPTEYVDETAGAQESLTIRESTLARGDIQQSFNVFERPAPSQEARKISIRNDEIASQPSQPEQPEQHHNTENMNFDLRQAIIYSEILTPKFKDSF